MSVLKQLRIKFGVSEQEVTKKTNRIINETKGYYGLKSTLAELFLVDDLDEICRALKKYGLGLGTAETFKCTSMSGYAVDNRKYAQKIFTWMGGQQIRMGTSDIHLLTPDNVRFFYNLLDSVSIHNDGKNKALYYLAVHQIFRNKDEDFKVAVIGTDSSSTSAKSPSTSVSEVEQLMQLCCHLQKQNKELQEKLNMALALCSTNNNPSA